jgi:CRP/FNR family transcriptional regulator
MENKHDLNTTIAGFSNTSGISKKLLEIGKVKSIRANEVIINDASYIKFIPIVLKGSLKVFRLEPNDKEILLYYIRPGETCVTSFFGGMHQEISKIKAVAEEDTEILFVPSEKIVSLVKEFPDWVEYILKMYHKRFEELLDVVNALAFQKVDERILNFLQTKSNLLHTNKLEITHEQIANEVGTARVVVSRILKRLEEDGVLFLERNQITLL